MAAASKKSTAKKAAATKKSAATKQAPTKQARKPAAKQAPAKKTPAKKTPAKKTPAKRAATKASAKSAPAKQAPAKRAATKASTKSAPAKQASGKQTTTQASAKPAPGTRTSAKQAPATTTKAPATKREPVKRTAARRSNTPQHPSTTKSAPTTMTSKTTTPGVTELPKPRFNKDGLGYTKDFDLSFVKEMHDLLQDERVRLTGQAKRLEDEAHQLVEEAEMGDVQFDDEGGEGDTMVVERERDLALSAQAREAVTEIDAALDRIKDGTYGYSIVSGRPIPKERLEAIPWASVLVEEKVGGIGRR